MKYKTLYLVLAIAMVLIVAAVIYAPTKRKHLNRKIAIDDMPSNANNKIKPYLVEVSYCDGKAPDTLFFYYLNEPTRADIQNGNIVEAYTAYEIPQIYTMVNRGPNARILLNVCNVRALRKGQYPPEKFDSILQAEIQKFHIQL